MSFYLLQENGDKILQENGDGILLEGQAPDVALNTPADAATGVSLTPDLLFTGTDIDSDEIEYNVQVATDNLFTSPSSVIDDSYSESNNSGEFDLRGSGGREAIGQTFTSLGGTLDSAKFNLKKLGSPTGNAVVRLYAHTGTYGTNGVPTGSALAVSDNFDVSTLTTTLALVTFSFTGANRITLTNGTFYVSVVEYSGGNASNLVNVGRDQTSPTHSGNSVYANVAPPAWIGDSTIDIIFYVYTATAGSLLLSKLSVTPDATFTNLTTPADTTPFNSGDQINYKVQAGDILTASTVYYWRTRGKDPSGSNTFGAWSATRSFTTAAGTSAALTGTVTTATETDIVTGGKTIILTLTGDTFIAAGTGPIGSTANTQALIDGIDSAQSETNGWDAVVKTGILTSNVVRTSATVATITLPAFASYDITANETITATIPAAVLTGAAQLVATPTFQVTPVSSYSPRRLGLLGVG